MALTTPSFDTLRERLSTEVWTDVEQVINDAVRRADVVAVHRSQAVAKAMLRRLESTVAITKLVGQWSQAQVDAEAHGVQY